MLFDFQTFIEELREKQDKKHIVEKYEKLFGPIQGNTKDQARYTEYVTKIEVVEYSVPDELKLDFDRGLLQQLVVGSFSSDYDLKTIENKENKELYIAVKTGDQSVIKTVSELWSFQVLRLYEIYIEEQMNLHSLKYEDEKEKEPIDQERELRLKKRQIVINNMDIEKEKITAKGEQQAQLDSLYDKL